MKNKYLTKGVIISGLCLLIGVIVLNEVLNNQSKEITVTYEFNKDVGASLAEMYSSKQLRFISNQGQAGTDANFHVQGADHTVLFDESKITLRRIESATKKNEIILRFAGADQNPSILGQKKLKSVAHFYKGNDPALWQTNVPTYGSVLYKDLYPGIDMAYIGDNGILESEFYVSPGADYNQIKLNYQGVISKRIEEDGSLMLETELGSLIEKTPYVYQEINGSRIEVEAEYILLADANIGFKLGSYEAEYPVVIDPELAFITTIPSATGVWFEGVVFDSNGDLVLAGAADRFFNANDEIEGSNHEDGIGNDGLLVKLDGTTGEVIFSALFGGSKTDYFRDVAIDEENNLFLSGLTASTDLPVMNADQNTSGGDHDAFFTKINSSGELTYSTYLGGSERDWGEGIAMDESGNVYVGGRTKSDDFPVLGGFQQQNNGGEWDMFVTKYNTGGSKVFATYLGGSENDRFTGIAVTASEMATISGVTESPDFPLKNAFQGTFGGGGFGEGDAFVSRFNNAGNDLIYSTYLGGDMADWSYDITIGNDGYTYITGGTASSNFPLVNGPSLPETGDADGIVAMFDDDGQPMYSVRTNISGYDEFNAIAVDDSSKAYPVGAWEDSIRIYEKMATDTLHAYFEFEAEGHQVNAVDLSGLELAFAGAYFGTSRDVAESGQGSAGKTQLDQFHIFLVNGCLNIISKPGVETSLWLNVDENGYVTVGKHGASPTKIKAEEVFCIYIKGNHRRNYVNLENVHSIDFPFIPTEGINITVDLSISEASLGAPNQAIGPADLSAKLIGGKGESQLVVSGDKGCILDGSRGFTYFKGGKGDDTFILYKGGVKSSSNFGDGNDLIIIRHAPEDIPNVSNYFHDDEAMILNDTLGIDTLDFSALDSRITLDLSLLNAEQTLDDVGTKVILEGIFEVLKGTEYDDIITVSPLEEDDQLIVGNGGNDILNFKAISSESVDDGAKISTPGYGDVYYSGIETVNMIIDDISDHEASVSVLHQNQPNPFDQVTSIKYHLKEAGDVVLKIYNASGQLLKILVDEKQQSGQYEVLFDASDMSNGIYYYSLTLNNKQSVKKMVKK